MDKLKELLDEGKLVELGQEIDKLNRSGRSREVVDFINKTFEEFKGKAEQFLDLSPDERLKMAFILAAKATVVEGMKTTQIRKILSMSNGIYRGIKTKKLGDISSDIAKMRYVLAYTASRHKGRKDPITPILEVSDKILRKLDEKSYEKFHEFLQAIVAYHVFLGGRD